ncbi:GntR family transcriptional regulator [Mycobacterium sp. WMMD1722]|uniref:GntR family transcriptional regulator n=1 Tax=Mycobacterium sp. WMMD1722 TaxID=3404117 RepID=UPI003BF4E4E2
MSVADRIRIVGRSSAQQIADGLMDMILEGELKPGERIRESVVADSLGISRNTVREAVRLLQGTGLVRYTFNRGLVVWDPSDDEVLDIYRARLHLETAAATALGPDTDLLPLVSAMEKFKQALATEDPRTIVESDLAIHRAIVGMMNSPRLDKFYDELLADLRYFLLVLNLDHHEYESGSGLLAEHQRIVGAFASRDPELARDTIAEIITENRDEVRKILAARSAG